MARSPRPDELRAAQIVRRGCAMDELHYADRPNGVDFVGHRGSRRVALEVTRFTSQDRRRVPALPGTAAATAHSWLVVCAGQPAMQHLEAALLELERHGIADFRTGEQLPAFAALAAEHVTAAHVIQRQPPHILLVPAGGADAALAALEGHLAREAHHVAKTAAATADERHLFIWLDGDTPYECAGVFLAEPPLPSRPPAIPEAIDHLWVVHEQTGHGWCWQDGDWSAVAQT